MNLNAKQCPVCAGTGKIQDAECHRCYGKGSVQNIRETAELTPPPPDGPGNSTGQ